MAITTENSGSWTTTHKNGTDVYRITTVTDPKRVTSISVSVSAEAPSTAYTNENMKALHDAIATQVKNKIGTAL